MSIGQGNIGFTTRSNRTISFWVGSLAFNPADNTTYFFASQPAVPNTSVRYQTRIPFSGTITAASIFSTSPTAGGTGEPVSLFIRLNNLTDFLVSTYQNTNPLIFNNTRIFENTSMNIPVNAGDLFFMKLVCPTWVTNPQGTIFGGVVILTS